MQALKYLTGALLRSYLIVAAGLLALFGLFNFMEQTSDIGLGSFQVLDAVLYVLLSLPAMLLDLAPFVAMLGTVYGLAGFIPTQELVALRAAGTSQLKLSAMVLLAAGILMALLAANELMARPLLQHATLLRAAATSADGSMLSRDGSWITRDNQFAFVGSYRGGQLPSDISVYSFGDDARLDTYLHAGEARIQEDGQWRLEDVVRKRLTDTPGIDTEHPSTLSWQPFWSGTTPLYDLPMTSLTLGDLRRHVAYLEQSGADATNYSLEFWRRCALPLSGLAFTLFAAQFMLGVGPRAGIGLPATLGGAATIGIYLFQQILTSGAILMGMAAVMAAFLPTLAVGALGGWLALRVNAHL